MSEEESQSTQDTEQKRSSFLQRLFSRGGRCACKQKEDDLYFCYRKVQGRWVRFSGGFSTREACEEHLRENC